MRSKLTQNLLVGAAVFVLLAGYGDFANVQAADEPAEAASHNGESGDAADHGEHAEGVPLNFKTDLALWSLFTFLFFVFVLRKFAWGPLIKGLDDRESRFNQQLADAEAARAKAEQLLAEHSEKLDQVQDEIREIIAEARRDAEHTKQEIVTEAQREAEATKQRSIAEIERARDQALKQMFDEVSSQVVAATEHVLGRSISDQDQDRLVQEALSQVSPSNN